jgi:hypothetical protein
MYCSCYSNTGCYRGGAESSWSGRVYVLGKYDLPVRERFYNFPHLIYPLTDNQGILASPPRDALVLFFPQSEQQFTPGNRIIRKSGSGFEDYSPKMYLKYPVPDIWGSVSKLPRLTKTTTTQHQYYNSLSDFFFANCLSDLNYYCY